MNINIVARYIVGNDMPLLEVVHHYSTEPATVAPMATGTVYNIDRLRRERDTLVGDLKAVSAATDALERL